jgi:hypothetical protein
VNRRSRAADPSPPADSPARTQGCHSLMASVWS